MLQGRTLVVRLLAQTSQNLCQLRYLFDRVVFTTVVTNPLVLGCKKIVTKQPNGRPEDEQDSCFE
jgi:hypothetical protein